MVAHAIAHQYVLHRDVKHKHAYVAFKLNYQQKTANAMAVSALFMTFLIGEMSC